MAYIANTPKVLESLGYVAERDFACGAATPGGDVSLTWTHADAQPREQDVATTAASPAFATWLEAHGGDAIKTAQQQAKDAFGASNADSLIRERAVMLTLIDELNLLRQWITSFKAATAASSSLADLKARVAALANMPDRTATQARNSVAAKIDSGGGKI